MPFAWVIIVILWWLISAANKTAQQKKRAQQAAPAAARPQKARDPAAPVEKMFQAKRPAALKAAEDDGWEGRGVPASPELAAAKPAPAPHDARPLEAHMHTPVMGEEGVGTEGIDCCHEFMLGDPDAVEPVDFLPLQEETENQRAKTLLQGVIYSEILGRRLMRRYGGKRPAA